MFDVQKFIDGVHEYIGLALAPIAQRLKALEDRAPMPGEPGQDGVDGADGRDGADGKDADPETIKQIVAESLAALPLPKDGADGVDGKDGQDGAPGKDAPPITADQVAEAIRSMPAVLENIVKAWLAENPPAAGKDGADGRDGKDAEPVSTDQISKAVASHLALNPPAPGRDGRDGLPGTKGIDGKNGADGRDGLAVKDFDATLSDDGRTLTLILGDGESRFSKQMVLPTVIDRGVFQASATYQKGDGVTWAGSFWIAQKNAPEGKPDTGSGWRLAVKRGRDGKDGTNGRDLTKGVPAT